VRPQRRPDELNLYLNYIRLGLPERCKIASRGATSYGGLENDAARDAAADFEPRHVSVLDTVNSAHQTAKFAAKLEITQFDFEPRTFVLVELHINQHLGRGNECGFSIRYS
jgi:hypothetical protein